MSDSFDPMDCSAPASPVHGIFFSQEYWSELLFPPPEDLRGQGIEFMPPASPALAGRFFASEPSTIILVHHFMYFTNMKYTVTMCKAPDEVQGTLG